MKTSARLGVTGQQISFGIHLPGQLKIGFKRVRVVIGVDEVLPCIVGRIDIDQFHAAEVWLKQKLQNFEVITFNEDISRYIKVDRLLWMRYQGRRTWCLQQTYGILFARPGKMKSSQSRFRRSAQRGTKFVKIN